MMRTLPCLIIYSIFILSCASPKNSTNEIDRNLVIPGKTAEGYNLGDRPENIKPVKAGTTDNIGKILDLDCFSSIQFDSYVYNRDTSVIFLHNGIITAIAGLKTERRITSDAVPLSRGIDNFILNYGNSGLVIKSRKKNKVYYYKIMGIAVFNDNNDNTIDMYLILPKQNLH